MGESRVLIFLFIRSISEVAITMIGYFNLDTLTHVLVIMTVAAYYQKLHTYSIKKPVELNLEKNKVEIRPIRALH